jgi:hypothetical protein
LYVKNDTSLDQFQAELELFIRLRVIYPLIEFGQGGVAFAASCAARGVHGQFAHLAFADPFAQHAPQGVGIHIEMNG